ncbi:MAG: glycosyltransferase family 25 protein [Alcanivorax jadensis]|uniref:glycosyltransferase family 25 protein n=1 Tax=Alcanivorax jadensis TaxID=64988 RepID=UPI0030035FF6
MSSPKQHYNILAIAQPSELERRKHLDEMLAALGMHYEIVKTSPPVPQDRWQEVGFDHQKSRALLGRDLSCGEIGCFLSHRAAWQIAAASDRPSLILEGDAELNLNSRNVCEMLSDRNSGWELAMLYYSKCIPSVWHQQRLDSTFRLAKFANRRAYCLAAYMLTPAGARKLAELSKSFYLPADDFVSGGWIRKDLDMFAVVPEAAGLCPVQSEKSNLEDDRQQKKTRKHKKKDNNRLLRRLELYLRELGQRYRPPRKSL